MADIYNDLVKHDFSNTPTNELNDIINRADDSVAGLMAGLQTIGNLAFLASESGNYTDSMASNDLRNIGEMLMCLPRIIQALNDTANHARYSHNKRLKGSEVAND